MRVWLSGTDSSPRGALEVRRWDRHTFHVITVPALAKQYIQLHLPSNISNCLETVLEGKRNLCWKLAPNSKGNFIPFVASSEFYFSIRRVIKTQGFFKSLSHQVKLVRKKIASTNLTTAVPLLLLHCIIELLPYFSPPPCFFLTSG